MFDFDVESVDTSNEFKGTFVGKIKTLKQTTSQAGNKMIVSEISTTFNEKEIVFKEYFVIDGPTGIGTKRFFNLVDCSKVNRKEAVNDMSLMIGKLIEIKVGKKKKEDEYSSILSISELKTDTSFETSEY